MCPKQRKVNMRVGRVSMRKYTTLSRGGRSSRVGCSSVHWEITPKRHHYGDASGDLKCKMEDKG